MKRRDLFISILAVLFFVLISLPYQFEFSYWAETVMAWTAYFVLASIFAVYIFYAFLQGRRRLMHDSHDSEEEQKHA
jgi:Ca2+/Na+ antiporter